MNTQEIIDTLRVCADEDILCPACPRYEKYKYGGTAECNEKLMLEAADALEAALREQEEREKPLSALLAPIDRYMGLKRKFLVFKSDTGEMIENCFVLRPDKDPAAVAALRAYAGATDNKTLAADIMDWVGEDRNDPLTLDELKQLPLKEWVWVEVLQKISGIRDESTYYRKCLGWMPENTFFCGYPGWATAFDYADYGKTWLAYRSKPKED